MQEKNDNWWSESLRFSALSHVGMRRSNNQDSYCVLPASTPRLWRAKGHLFIVADGMGAHAAGEYASKLAVDVVSQSYLKRLNEPTREALDAAMHEAHETIRKRGDSDEAFHDMGTTCDALTLGPEGAYIAHVGDSRVYRLRAREYAQLTFDHSLVWEIKRDPSSHAHLRQIQSLPKNIITRSLGPIDNLKVDVEGPFELAPGDVFLLCSDGLSGQIQDSEMGQILELFPPEEATETLVNLANLRGGPDNITVVVARIEANLNLPELEKECEKADKIYQKRQPLSVAAWACLALGFACLVATTLCLFAQFEHRNIAIACGSSFVAAFAFVFACLSRRSSTLGRSKEPTREETRVGKAPYVVTRITFDGSFDDMARRLCDDLCAAIKEQPAVAPDWRGVDEARRRAAGARAAKDYANSLRTEFRVINYIMRELKKFNLVKK